MSLETERAHDDDEQEQVDLGSVSYKDAHMKHLPPISSSLPTDEAPARRMKDLVQTSQLVVDETTSWLLDTTKRKSIGRTGRPSRAP